MRRFVRQVDRRRFEELSIVYASEEKYDFRISKSVWKGQANEKVSSL